MALLRSQEGWVFEALTRSGFDPRAFVLAEGVTHHAPCAAPTLEHRPSGELVAGSAGLLYDTPFSADERSEARRQLEEVRQSSFRGVTR